MVFAKTSKAAARLSDDVRERRIKKEYLVVADGKFENKKGTLEDYLLKNERKNISRVVKESAKGAKIAKLDYEVLKYNEEIDLSVLKILLHTGRHHQIRVQLANINHSIYGDQKYGTRGRRKADSSLVIQIKLLSSSNKKALVFQSSSRNKWNMENNRRIRYRLANLRN